MPTTSYWRRMRMSFVTAIAGAICFPGIAHAGSLEEICDDCTFEKWAECGDFIEGINFDREGHGWVVSVTSGEIHEVVDGECTLRATTGGRANGSRFHKDGRLFIADQQRGVLTYDPATGEVAVFADTVEGEKMVNANDLVFDENGGLYVTVPGLSSYFDHDGKVIYFAPGSDEAQVIADDLAYPNGIALHPDGRYLNIGLFSQKRIITIPSAAHPQTFRPPYLSVLTEGGIGPDGMTMDSEGRLYWANFNSGAIGITDARGFVLGYAKLPDEAGRFTTNISFHDGYLYLTEGAKNEIWRMKVKTTGQTLFDQQ